MKVRVTIKAPVKAQAEQAFKMAVFAIDTVMQFKERILSVVPLPFPQIDLVLPGVGVLSECSNLVDCGVKDGSVLEVVIKASEATLVRQLTDLMPAGYPMRLEELSSLYGFGHGATVDQALGFLGVGGTLRTFLSANGKHFASDAEGRVTPLLRECNSAPAKDMMLQEVSTDEGEDEDDDSVSAGLEDVQDLMEEAVNELDLYMHDNTSAADEGTAQRLRHLTALLTSVQSLQEVAQAMDSIQGRLEKHAKTTAPATNACQQQPHLAVGETAVPAPWQRKESSQYPGRFYFVNGITGKTVWKLPPTPSALASVATLAAAPPAASHRASFSPPPGLSPPSPMLAPPPGLLPPSPKVAPLALSECVPLPRPPGLSPPSPANSVGRKHEATKLLLADATPAPRPPPGLSLPAKNVPAQISLSSLLMAALL